MNINPLGGARIPAAPAVVSRSRAVVWAVAAAPSLLSAAALAQSPPEDSGPAILDPVVVTATRSAERSFDVAAGVDRIDAATIHTGRPMVNLTETLTRVPGLVSLNRQNYAQDLQISSRGFGARAAFGVRGVRLYQDDIPATMPDGQGQTGSFSLLSAESIEVLRGPYSSQYGNASGGVINVTTEDGRRPPTAAFNASAGSDGMRVLGLALNGRTGDDDAFGYVAAASRFDTDGYREHSAARRDLVNAKATWVADGTRVTMIANSQDQPETQDPLGLTRAQWQANPRQVDPSAIQFDTKKTIRQQQGGVSVEQRLAAPLTLKLSAYAGHRDVRQNLALSGIAETSSGGIVDLDRDYGGISTRLTLDARLGGMPLKVTAGVDVDRLREHRMGFVNDNGALGAVRRNEIDVVTNEDAYAQLEWLPVDRLSLAAGIRHSDVRFTSDDRFVTALNPDDSGRRNFSRATPFSGITWHATSDVNVYASYGEGFETPTFAEMAYRNGGTGLNFGLRPATSRSLETGLKWIGGHGDRVNVAAFTVHGRDEIVTDTASGGRTTFRNASATRREGAEALWDSRWAGGVTTHLAYTYLKAWFVDDFSGGSPAVLVPAGSRLPGVPESYAYGEIAWKPDSTTAVGAFQAALELMVVDRIFINDRNSDATPRAFVANAWAGLEQALNVVTLREYVRLDNALDRRYVGSVIVGDANGRSFEPAPGRNWSAGVTAIARF